MTRGEKKVIGGTLPAGLGPNTKKRAFATA
jgi:hypothetical protein